MSGVTQLAPEIAHLERLLDCSSPVLRRRKLATVSHKGVELPLWACAMGSEARDVPVMAFIGGIHGVERIGSQVVLAFLESLVQRLEWDDSLATGLERLRLLFVPIANPAGLIRQTRANDNGVDLMRNAPVEATGKVPMMVSGQRLSRHLPWYRGKKNEGMETEAQALFDLISASFATAPVTLLLDVHSGYGFRDRLWFPLACSPEPVAHLAEFFALYRLLFKTYPHLDYVFEPQSHHYLTHGDLWDALYLKASGEGRLLLPLTLEMGSWNWVKKNPRQLGSFFGLFNPVKPHRLRRVLRRHTVLMECLIRAARAHDNWLPRELARENARRQALELWYENAERGNREPTHEGAGWRSKEPAYESTARGNKEPMNESAGLGKEPAHESAGRGNKEPVNESAGPGKEPTYENSGIEGTRV